MSDIQCQAFIGGS